MNWPRLPTVRMKNRVVEIFKWHWIVQRLFYFTVNRWPCFIPCMLMFVPIETRPVYLGRANDCDHAYRTGKKSSLPTVSHCFAVIKVFEKKPLCSIFSVNLNGPLWVFGYLHPRRFKLHGCWYTAIEWDESTWHTAAFKMNYGGGNGISLNIYDMYNQIHLKCSSCRCTIKGSIHILEADLFPRVTVLPVVFRSHYITTLPPFFFLWKSVHVSVLVYPGTQWKIYYIMSFQFSDKDIF